ncbi:jg2362 [Pararge aegeria aegeria]|uniref:Jg2362 protein n=1 Tax=Pararge aegeria aegeria TaxID=348720 RepID=A0A8S4SJ40_9NEOP|nr:jg2362 [Pararge aegeria aegeria]
MSRAHSSEKGWTLGSQGAGMAAPNWCWNGNPEQTVNAALVGPEEVDERHRMSRWALLETSGPRPWILELPTKGLCPEVDEGMTNEI